MNSSTRTRLLPCLLAGAFVMSCVLHEDKVGVAADEIDQTDGSEETEPDDTEGGAGDGDGDGDGGPWPPGSTEEFVCSPDLFDTFCVACLKDRCCEQLVTCFGDPDCSCFAPCYEYFGHFGWCWDQCIGARGPATPVLDQYMMCHDDQCDEQCFGPP